MFRQKSTYSIAQIESVASDTTFSHTTTEEVLIATKDALVDMGFEIENEQKDLIVTFPMTIEKENFGEYAVEKLRGGYEPVRENRLYEDPSLQLYCLVVPSRDGIMVKIKTIFEAFHKDMLYREVVGKDINESYYEIKGDFIECKSTGRTEKALFDRITNSLRFR
jgi:hypothetical protein